MSKIQIKDFLRNFNQQTHRGSCIACGKDVTWNNERLASHKRLNCPTVTEAEKELFKKRKAPEDQPSGDNSFVHEASSSSSGISFRLADSDSFKAFVSKINPGYAKTMPSAKKLSGSLLDQNYSTEAEKLNNLLRSSINLTLISDGWTNVNGEHIVNYSVKAPGHKPLFKCSANTSGIIQDAKAISEAICKVLEELGSEKFCSVVTDNASVMRAAWKQIELRFPHISANGCAAHAMNLLIKDLLNDHDQTLSEAATVIKFVNNHHLVLAKFEARRKEAKVEHKLSLPVITRWYSQYHTLKNLNSAKYVLIKLCDEESEVIQSTKPRPTAVAVVNLIKSSDFWLRISKCIKLIEYPTQIIGKNLNLKLHNHL